MIGKKNEYGKLEILGLGKSKSLGIRGVVNNYYANYTVYTTSNPRCRK
jgi:hypothetical protein